MFRVDFLSGEITSEAESRRVSTRRQMLVTMMCVPRGDSRKDFGTIFDLVIFHKKSRNSARSFSAQGCVGRPKI